LDFWKQYLRKYTFGRGWHQCGLKKILAIIK